MSKVIDEDTLENLKLEADEVAKEAGSEAYNETYQIAFNEELENLIANHYLSA